MKQFDIITIFPEILDSYINESLFKRAQKNKILKVNTHNLRKWTRDRHKTVDDKPYGGGVGLVFKADIIMKALNGIRKKKNKRIILLAPAGKRFNQASARRLSKYDQLIFVCPRYEGVDERVNKMVDEKISIGDYVLTGGELPAMVIADAVARHYPGFVGKKESIVEESFSREGYLEYPQYTRPEEIKYQGKNLKVPGILLSGNHAKIKEWRESNSKTSK